MLISISMLYLVFSLLLTNGFASGEPQSMSIEGETLGFYPHLAEGIRMEESVDSQQLRYSRSHRCLENVVTQDGVNAEVNLTGYSNSSAIEVAYPLGGEGGGLLPPPELVKAYYRDNIAGAHSPSLIRLMFVPQILTPRPEKMVNAMWTEKARQLLAQNDKVGFKNYCGTHFVSGRGEDNYILYSIRIELGDSQDQPKFERIFDDVRRQTPSLIIDRLSRMRRRFEFVGSGNKVTLDVLHVGDSAEALSPLQNSLAGWPIVFELEKSNSSLITRASATCVPEHMEPCERLAQAFLDFQYGRFDFRGEEPTFTPVRFQLTPYSSLIKR